MRKGEEGEEGRGVDGGPMAKHD
eukprot:COSAG02_NODE_30412_length_550_cov_1.384956_1_plen_22_part_10